MAVIRLEDVTKIFPFQKVNGLFNRREQKKIREMQESMPYTSNEGVVALQHISLTIRDGEFVAVLGPSGSGKTTLLRIIAGLEDASLGQVYYDDTELKQIDINERDIAMVFQNYSLYPNQTVYQNIAFPLEVKHLPREEVKEKVEAISALLGLEKKLQRLPDELSGGEKQRVAIARAMVKEPSVLLLDEPFANLDTIMKQRLRKQLKQIHERFKTTFIYVTHDQYDALALADRIIILKDGIIQMDGSTVEVYNEPVNRFCGEFLGSPVMNFFEDVRVRGNAFELLGKTYDLSDAQRKKIKKNGSITVGIRGVNIAIGREGYPAVVDYVEVIEADQIIRLTCDGQKISAVEKMNDDQGTVYLKGEEVKILPDEKRFHLFDPEGNRI